MDRFEVDKQNKVWHCRQNKRDRCMKVETRQGCVIEYVWKMCERRLGVGVRILEWRTTCKKG